MRTQRSLRFAAFALALLLIVGYGAYRIKRHEEHMKLKHLAALTAAFVVLHGTAAHAQTYSNNFDGLTPGASVSGWTNGSGSAFAVRANNPYSGANAFGETTAVDGHFALYTAASYTDSTIQCTQRANTSGGNQSLMGAWLRADSTAQNGYLISYSYFTHAADIYKVVSGGYTSLSTVTLPAYADGTFLKLKGEAVGNVIHYKLYPAFMPEPGAWTGTATDGTFTSGYDGLRVATGGTPTIAPTADDLFIGSAGTQFPPAPMTTAPAFSRAYAEPVIVKGTTYNGTQADALAAPAVCYDAAGSRWVMLCDAWNVSTSKWYNLAFTSPDLAAWTYVAGSKQSPTGGNYITGNGGLIKAGSLFYRVFNAYPSASPGLAGVYEASSPDLVTWTAVNGGTAIIATGTAGSGDEHGAFDPALTYNPNTSLYECWYCGLDTVYTGRVICYATSLDCVTWTKRGIAFGPSAWNINNIGEPQAFYIGADRYVTFDSGITNGIRQTALAVQKGSTGAWAFSSAALIPVPDSDWEQVNVFDGCCVGAIDRGDGRGVNLWMVYAGTNIVAATDATQSSLGLAYAPLPSNGTKRRPQ